MELTEPPGTKPDTFLDFAYQRDLDNLDADIAVLGIPFGMPYESTSSPNDQSNAPDAIRQASSESDTADTRNHFDWDLGGSLLDGRDIKVVDCGNVTADKEDSKEHYRRAEQAARKIFAANSTLITLGGDHGVPIPVMRALEVFGEAITLIHVDAHLDWRHEVNGETEGYSSPIRRAAEMPWIDKIVQGGMRGIGSARDAEVRDGLDPTIMPAVMAPTPGGLDWLQIRQLVHGLIKKGRVVGMDLVEIAPSYDVGNITMVHAERLICNFIGAAVRAGYYDG